MRLRSVLAGLTLTGMLGSGAVAESRIFIIANNADGYGVDRCLARGESCGRTANHECNLMPLKSREETRNVDPCIH